MGKTTAQDRILAAERASLRKLDVNSPLAEAHSMACWPLVVLCCLIAAGDDAPNFRKPASDAELRYWLENMVWHHGFNAQEISAATGLSDEEVAASLQRFNISAATKPKRHANSPLLVLPYP